METIICVNEKCRQEYDSNLSQCPSCGSPNPMMMECSNEMCKREYNINAEKCPYCGEANPLLIKTNPGIKSKSNMKNTKSSFTDKSAKSTSIAKMNGWYFYSKTILIISIISFLVLIIISLVEEDASYALIGLGEFVGISFFCAIVQLLAGIKQSVDALLRH